MESLNNHQEFANEMLVVKEEEQKKNKRKPKPGERERKGDRQKMRNKKNVPILLGCVCECGWWKNPESENIKRSVADEESAGNQANNCQYHHHLSWTSTNTHTHIPCSLSRSFISPAPCPPGIISFVSSRIHTLISFQFLSFFCSIFIFAFSHPRPFHSLSLNSHFSSVVCVLCEWLRSLLPHPTSGELVCAWVCVRVHLWCGFGILSIVFSYHYTKYQPISVVWIDG